MLFNRIFVLLLLCAFIQITHSHNATIILQESENALVCEDATIGSEANYNPDQNYGNSDTLISQNCPS